MSGLATIKMCGAMDIRSVECDMWLKIPIDLETDAAKAHLLKELDRWIELGLLSEGQAISIGRKLCMSYANCL